MISGLRAGSQNSPDLFERLVTVLLEVQAAQSGEIWREGEPRDFYELIGLTSPFFVASRLDSMCRHFGSRFGRFAACTLTAERFYGRCEAYRHARRADTAGVEAEYVSGSLARCEAGEGDTIGWLRTNDWRSPGYDANKPVMAEQRRLAMRLYASSMDRRLREAACEAAATMPEARDIPECATPGESQDEMREPR
jgi:hypothetical protein